MSALRAQDEPVFKADAKDVLVDTAVTRTQRPLRGLRAEDFLLFENGQSQTIRALTIDELPVDLLLIFYMIPPPETKTKVAKNIDAASRARLMNGAANVLLQTRSGDRVAFLSHSAPPRIELPFTGDRATIGAALRSMSGLEFPPGFSESLTIEYAVRMFAELGSTPGRRRLIVRLGTAIGGAVPYADESVIRRLWSENIIYSSIEILWPTRDFNPGSMFLPNEYPTGPSSTEPVAPLYRRMNPFHLAEATGGDSIWFLDPKDPLDLVTPVRQRYGLWFRQPDGLDPGQPRTISVELSPEIRNRYADAVVKARNGYITR